MKKTFEGDIADEPEDKKELSAEEKELLKRLEKGEVEEVDAKKGGKSAINNDPKYEAFTQQGYEVNPAQGLIYKDYDMISKQRRVIFHLVKSMGSNLLKGKSIMNVSLPVTIFDKESLLQRTASDFLYAPYFVEKIYAAEDPIDKMKWTVAFYVAGLHLGICQKKPFNPVWGETFQGKIDNINVYCEQTSHHPPISNIYMDGEHFTIDTKHQFSLSTYPNSATFKCIGHRRIVLKDANKTTYMIEYPWAECKGFMFGNRVVNYKGNVTITDTTNKIYVQLRMQAGEKSLAEGLFRKNDARADFFKGLITKNPELLKDMSRKAFYSKDMISYIEGNWFDYVMIDGDNYWEIDKVKPGKLVSVPDPLPSDSTFRPDLRAFIEGNDAEAQKQKEILEEIQRNDRKLREQATKKK